MISKYEIVNENNEQKDFINVSHTVLEKIWDNKEDSVYDKYLKGCCYCIATIQKESVLENIGKLTGRDIEKLEALLEIIC